MDKSSKKIIKEKQSSSKRPQVKTAKTGKKSNKRVKGQKDIRTLIKTKKNELLTYSKHFDLICKQSGIDVDPEQLQLAIALSKSLQDNKYTDDDRSSIEKSLTCNQRRSQIRTTLQKYGFKTKKNPSKKEKRYRKHYNLVLVSETEKQQRIADKYAQILFRNVCVSKTNQKRLYKKGNVNSYLYNLTTNVLYDFIKNDEIFYVNNLVPKSVHKQYIFKDWSKIPGRPVSPKLEILDQSFKGTECSQEDLDNILSGPIERAQDIIKRNYRNISSKFEIIKNTILEDKVNQQNFTEIKAQESAVEVFCENKTINNNFIRSIDIVKYNSPFDMSPPTNRSCSPDLFDDEVTIIMDSSNDKISLQEGVSERTNEQNDLMELTDCINILSDNYTHSKHIACLSHVSYKAKSNSSDFMDLTECIPACSQKNWNNLQSSSSYANTNDNCSLVQKDNHTEVSSLKKCQNFTNTIKTSSGSDKNSLDDTIIVIDEDYDNINNGNKWNLVNSTSEENVIDLIGSQYKSSSDARSKYNKYNDSVIDLKQIPKKNIDNSFDKSCCQLKNPDNGSCKIIPHMYNRNSEEKSGFAKDNEHLDTVDLTQPSNFVNSLSLVNVQSMKSGNTYEIHTELDSIPNSTRVLSRNTDHNKMENKNVTEYIDDEKPENWMSLKTMDPTQSSNSENCLQEVVQEDCVNTKSLNDKITLKTTNNYEIIQCVDLYKGSPEQSENYSNNLNINYKTNAKKNDPKIFDGDNDREFDNLIENESNNKQNTLQTSELYDDKKYLNEGNSFVLLDNCTIENEPSNEVLDLTQNYDCSSDNLFGPKDLSNKSRNVNDNAQSYCINGDFCVIEVEEEIINGHNSINETVLNFDNNCKFDNVCVDISESKQGASDSLKLYCENKDANSDFDITQQSDCSETTLCSPKIVEVPFELGKQNNMSIDYDEVCEANITRECETISLSDNNKFNTKSGTKDEGTTSLSQHSEVFDLSDNEFNYSVNQHMQDNDSLILQQSQFNIGGISIIDEILNRNSLLRRSQLRCSCRSNDNTIYNEVESCSPVVDLKTKENILGKNINEESNSCEEVELVKISTPLKCRSDDNILIAKTPKHDDYVIKTDQVTPMPNYEGMTSPERNEELDKFGIKPLKRKRAIQILTHIYNQTHPFMEVISRDEYSSPSKIRKTNNVETFPRRAIAFQIDSTMAKHSAESSNPSNVSQKSSKSHKMSLKNSQKSPKQVSRKEKLYEETTSIPVIRNIECSPDDWAFQKREKAKVHSCRVPLHIAFHNYVSSRTALRQAILKYEPINIDDIHKGLVAIGYRYNPKDLLKFMDRKCITVKTADNSRKNKET